MADTYTKSALPLVVGALIVLAEQNMVRPAGAQSGSCSTSLVSPCYITETDSVEVEGSVRIDGDVSIWD